MIRCACCGLTLRDESGRFLGQYAYCRCDYCGALTCGDMDCIETDEDGLSDCRLCWGRKTLPVADYRGIDPQLVDAEDAP